MTAGKAALITAGLGAMGLYALVVSRARREWEANDELTRPTALAISGLYVLSVATLVLAVAVRPLPLGVPAPLALGIGALLFLGGTLLLITGMRPFGSFEKLYGVERGGLIQGGIYDRSRHPQYVGLAMCVAAIGIGARSGVALAFAAAFAIAMWVWVARVEEPHLVRAFGERYRRYRREVPAVLGPKRRA